MADGIVFTDGEPLLADSLNTLQQTLYDRIKAHTHTGAGEGPQLGSASLQDNAVGTAQVHDGAITQAKLDPALFHALKDGPSTLGRLHYRPAQVKSAGGVPTLDDTGAAGASAGGGAGKMGTNMIAPGSTGIVVGNIGGIVGNIGGIIGNPILLRSEWDVSPQDGSNIKAVYRLESDGEGVPSVVRVEFLKAYKDANYIVTVTSEWDRPTAPQPLLVRKRDPAYVDLTVPSGQYPDLTVSFNLTIYGDPA